MIDAYAHRVSGRAHKLSASSIHLRFSTPAASPSKRAWRLNQDSPKAAEPAAAAAAGPGASSASDAPASITELTLGNKPPCPRFKELVKFTAFAELVGEYYSVPSSLLGYHA